MTAEPVAVKLSNSAPLVSKILVPILGDVKVLFVKVWVPVSVTVPAVASGISITPVLVPTPSRYKSLYPLSVVEKVTVSNDRDWETKL